GESQRRTTAPRTTWKHLHRLWARQRPVNSLGNQQTSRPMGREDRGTTHFRRGLAAAASGTARGGRRRCIARPAVDSGYPQAPCDDRFGAGLPAAVREPFQPKGLLSSRPGHRLRARHYHKNFVLLLTQYYTKKLSGSKGKSPQQAVQPGRARVLSWRQFGREASPHDGTPAFNG